MIKSTRLWLSTLHDRWEDQRFGIQTRGLIVPTDTAGQDGCLAYLPLSYRSLSRLFASVQVRPGQDVFIDFGSGLSRVPLFAARQPFRRVIGVELSKSLHDVAERNARAALPKLACREVRMVQADAREFAVPPDATVIYFFMPFDESILARVIDNIKASVDAHPREVTILYVKPVSGPFFIEPVSKQRPWLRLQPAQMLSSTIVAVRGAIGSLRAALVTAGAFLESSAPLLALA
jgi:hypothetical protein